MIIKETIEFNGVQYAYQYSDKGFYIERDGVMYSEAIDPFEIVREYKETHNKIENDVVLYREYLTNIVCKTII